MPSIKHSLDDLKGLDLNIIYINMQSYGEDNIDEPFRAEHTVTYSHLGVSAVSIAKTTTTKKNLFSKVESKRRDQLLLSFLPAPT